MERKPTRARSAKVAVDINKEIGVSFGKTATAPPVPAGTMAALATIVPVGLFRVETMGCGTPTGQTVR